MRFIFFTARVFPSVTRKAVSDCNSRAIASAYQRGYWKFWTQAVHPRLNQRLPGLLICLFALAACNTINQTKTFTPQSSRSDQAIVYIYRPSTMSNAIYSPDLYINDAFKLSINNGGSSLLSLKPAEYKFALKSDKNYSGATLFPLKLSAGNIYFIRVDTLLKINNTLTYEPYKRSFSLTKVDEQRAKKEIAECCMANNINSATDQQTKTVKKPTEDGFSVDKTKNPFSH